MLYSSPDGRGVWGRMDTRICMAEPLGFPPETITALFVNQLYSIQLKIVKKKKEKEKKEPL